MLTLLMTLILTNPAFAEEAPPRQDRPAALVRPTRSAPRPAPTPELERLEISVWVVEGRHAPGPVDRELIPLSRELHSKGLHSFELMARTENRVLEGELVRVPHAGRRIEVQLLQRTEEQARILVRLWKAGQAEPTEIVTWLPRGQALLVAGHKTAAGRLLYPVTVR